MKLKDILGQEMIGVFGENESEKNEGPLNGRSGERFFLKFANGTTVMISPMEIPHWELDGALDIEINAEKALYENNRLQLNLGDYHENHAILKEVNLIYKSDGILNQILKTGRVVQIEFHFSGGLTLSIGYFRFKNLWEFIYTGEIGFSVGKSILSEPELFDQKKFTFKNIS